MCINVWTLHHRRFQLKMGGIFIIRKDMCYLRMDIHHYRAYSGPAIPVGNGMHVHYYDFNTTEDDGHSYHVKGVDQPAPGSK